ncbi:unnamed protein product [Notodromas monacha]|uniref:Uncharacterized protein n=1 Tax=Notodromas monacha TaxID=399045 RepID=A0A7R9BY19_9CRUS|nr:unnamed protein product [Notodromas monacha]CAG0922238.1 unnamed protein product [Notodromas monacha]
MLKITILAVYSAFFLVSGSSALDKLKPIPECCLLDQACSNPDQPICFGHPKDSNSSITPVEVVPEAIGLLPCCRLVGTDSSVYIICSQDFCGDWPGSPTLPDDVTAATCCYTFESGTTICDIYSCMNSGPTGIPYLEGPKIPIGESEDGIHHLYTCCQPNCGVNGCSPVCRECDL